jgi:hypothetical protein
LVSNLGREFVCFESRDAVDGIHLDKTLWPSTSPAHFSMRVMDGVWGGPKILQCFVHCWHAVGTAATKAYLFCSLPLGIEMPTIRSGWDSTSLGGSRLRIWTAQLQRTQSAAVLRALLARCCNGSS